MKPTAIVVLWLAVPAAVQAQLASDEIPRERTVRERDLIQKEMEESPYRVGPPRFAGRWK